MAKKTDKPCEVVLRRHQFNRTHLGFWNRKVHLRCKDCGIEVIVPIATYERFINNTSNTLKL